VAALVLPVTISLNSHAAAGEELTVLATAADWIHTVGAGFWLGGLALFTLVLRAGLVSADPEERSRLLARVLPRFSLLAIASVSAVTLTGLFQGALLVGNVEDTFESGFGQSLVAKTLILAPMLGLGALHLFRVSPAFRRIVAQAGRLVMRPPVEALFRRTLPLEAALGLALLLATGFLTDTAPPDRAAAAPQAAFAETRTANDLDVRLTVDPARPGRNLISIYLTDRRGVRENVVDVRVRFVFLDEPLGESEVTAEPAPDSTYRVDGLQLSLPGRWHLLVIVQREGVEDARPEFEVPVTRE
jgi:copper transport protein